MKTAVCLLAILVVVIIYASIKKRPVEHFSVVHKVEKFTKGNDFYVYNYFTIPIDVKVVPVGSDDEEVIVESVPSAERLGVKRYMVNKKIRAGSIIRAYESGRSILLSESTLKIPANTTIKALHVGLISAHEDLGLAGTGMKSSMGTALSHVRLVNASPRCLSFTIGWDNVTIQPNTSLMYFGENTGGIHLGSVIRDVDKYMPDFTIDKPMTDIHFGFISDIQTPLYTGSKFGGDLDDTVEVVNHSLELHGVGGPHRGSLRDRSVIV